MPSVTDVQQQSSNNNGRSPSISSQQQQTLTDADPLTQAILVLEKKQRNLGKRKEKLESYEQEAKSGKELHKDQKEALAKYPEVLGQIDCAKEFAEQLKKIQTESSKNQKRLSKQIAEEKRSHVSQRLREYAQLRYLLDHRPTTLKPEESSLLDELSRVIVPSDNLPDTISRSIDAVLSIYQGGPSSSFIKSLGKTPQEIRDILEGLMTNFHIETSSEVIPEQEQTKELEEISPLESSSNKNFNEYPLQFDTRNQNIPLEQIIEDNTFFPIDLTKTQLLQEENNNDQSPDPKQYLQTLTIVNSSMTDQPSSSIQSQQEENSTNLTNDEQQQQQSEEQWQHSRGSGSAQRGGQYNHEGGNRHYNRGWANNYNQQQQQQQWRGPRGGRYDNSHSGGQRQYYDNTRGRGGSNSNYRGHRGGNYRGGNRGNGGYNGNGYQQSSHYQQNNEQQYQQARPAPPPSQQQ